MMKARKFFGKTALMGLLVQGLALPLPARAADVTDELRMTAKDEAGNEVKALKAELLISKNEEKALAQLKKLLAKYKGTGMEASLHFRLAELYIRRAKTSTFFELHKDEKNVIQFSPQATKSQSSRQWITKAVDTYDLIQRKFTHFRDMDLVLFNNAFARQMLGQEKQAMVLYKQVIHEYDQSPLVPDCHLAVGEQYFNDKKFKDAYDEFEKIRQYPDAKVYPYGLYKGAWALYNLRQTEKGLKQLEEVVAYSKQLQTEESHNRMDLMREALEDMVVFYEDVKPPSEAVSYFKKQAGTDQYGSLLLKLGRILQRHGKLAQVEVVYNDLLSETPMVAERPEIHKDLIDTFEMRNMREKAIAQLEGLSELCKETSDWARAQKLEAKKECVEQLTQTATIYAAKWHKEFNKSKFAPLGSLTKRAYESLILSGFPFPEEDKMRFSYAELLFQLGEFRKASPQYSLVAHITKDAKLRHDSSYAALVSIEKSIKDGKWSDADEELFAKLAADYIQMNPKGQYVTDVKFKKAFIAYDKNKYDRAAPELKELAVMYSNTERGKKAAQLYLDILNIQKRFEALKTEALYFSKKSGFDENTKAEFNKIYQQAYFTLVQNLENDKKYSQAAHQYAQFVMDNPKSNLADKAQFSAVRCANLAGDLYYASQLSEALIKNFPQSQHVMDVTKNLVGLYEAQAQLGLAAKTLVKLSEMDEKQKLSYLLTAADYKALNNEWSQALQLYNTLSSKYPNSKEGKTAVQRSLAIEEKNGQNTDKLLSQIEAMDLQPQSSLAALKIAKKACDAKDDEACFRLSKKVINQKSEKNVSTWAIAQARLQQGKVLEKEFDLTGMKTSKAERLGLVLKIKMEKLERVQKAYQETIGMGDKQTAIEALVKLAGVYEKFSGGLRSITAPKELSDNDKQKFLQEIENFAIPMEEKNAETLQIALKQAKQMQLHDGTVAKIQEDLNRLSKKSAVTKLVSEVRAPENALPKVN